MRGTRRITVRYFVASPTTHESALDYAAHLRHLSDLLHCVRCRCGAARVARHHQVENRGAPPPKKGSRCSEQNRRKAVTQSYGTNATSSLRPPGRQRVDLNGRSWWPFLLGESMPFTFKLSQRLA